MTAHAELGINLQHIRDKSLTVLNPFHSYSATHARDAHMMDDADLAGPLMFCFAFGMMLLLVSQLLTTRVAPAEPHAGSRANRSLATSMVSG